MNLTQYLLDVVLLALVLRQIRESRFELRFVLLSFAVVGWAAVHYLGALPSGGLGLGLVVGFAALGLGLGLVGGLATRVRPDGLGHALVKAGPLAASLWVASMGFRLAFAIWANTGAGGADLTRFSVLHGIDSASVYADALVLMALLEVVVRMGILSWRAYRVRAAVPGRPADRTLATR